MKRNDIIEFKSLENTIGDLDEKYPVDLTSTHRKVQFDQIDKILIREDVKTVYREEYTYTHYIEDYSGHYASCFHDYPKKCIRLHFFTKRFDETALKKFLSGENPERNWKTYLGEYAGFIILRPIPQAILGNVCLRAPKIDGENRVITKRVCAHLWGLTLTVDTIPFQEQDNAISACATVAVWAALHAVKSFDDRKVPSPYRLTENARKLIYEGRSYQVSRGLTMTQMMQAVRDESLLALECVPHSNSYAKALFKAYLGAGFPVIVGIDLYYRSDKYSEELATREIGRHAVTLLGWKEGDVMAEFDAPDEREDENIKDKGLQKFFLESSFINGWYCHDDQLGPYSIMKLPDEYSPGYDTDWHLFHNRGPVGATLYAALVPCSPQVRIRFSTIYNIVKSINKVFNPGYQLLGMLLSWDIRLETVNTFKEKILSNHYGVYDEETKLKLLSQSMPLYLWVVEEFGQPSACEEDGIISRESREKMRLATCVFDATDVPNSDFLLQVLHPSSNFFTTNLVVLTESLKDGEKSSESEKNKHYPLIVRKLEEHYTNSNSDKIIVNKGR